MLEAASVTILVILKATLNRLGRRAPQLSRDVFRGSWIAIDPRLHALHEVRATAKNLLRQRIFPQLHALTRRDQRNRTLLRFTPGASSNGIEVRGLAT